MDAKGLSVEAQQQDDSSTAKLMMYMFPRQFSLHNVFTSNVNSLETAQKFKDYTFREDEIALLSKRESNCSLPRVPKIPRRLRGSCWNLVRRLQTLHSRCSYSELLNHYCPRPNSRSKENLDSTNRSPSDNFTDRKVQDPSASKNTRTRHTVEEKALLAAVQPNHARQKRQSLVDLATSTTQVAAFCGAVLSNIIPNEFWGSGEGMLHNKKLVLQKADRFIKLRRFESMTLHDVLQGIRVRH